MFTWLESTKVARSRAVQPDFALTDWIIAILTKYHLPSSPKYILPPSPKYLSPPSAKHLYSAKYLYRAKYLYNAKYLYKYLDLTVGSAPASSKVVTTSE